MSDLLAGLDAVAGRLRAAGCVFAEDEARVIIRDARNQDDLGAMVEQRAAGVPLEHVLGWAEFCGVRISVGPGVFVPRRRTEFLVQQATALAHPPGRRGGGAAARAESRTVVLDICCGSGAVGVALATAIGPAELHAADLDPVAVGCARRNVARVGGRVYQGDLFDPLPESLRGRVDLLTANVPYVPTGEIALLPAEARLHEARVALDGGADGLEVLRRVSAQARLWLAPGGHLLVETSERQLPLAVEIFASAGLVPDVARSQELGATVIIGTAPARHPG